MFVYIFEDGTVQKHSKGPTVEDRAAIANGILIVLHSLSDVKNIDENLQTASLTDCRMVKPFDDLGEYHEPV